MDSLSLEGLQRGHAKAVGAVKDIDKTKKLIRVAVSSETRDRDGETIDPNGWQLDWYKQNPVVFFGHNSRGFPIGQAIPESVEVKDGVLWSTDKLAMDLPFKGEWGDFIHDAGLLIMNGDLRAVSAGFSIMSWKDADGATHERMHGDPHPSPSKDRLITVAEKWEHSIVGIPTNPSAGRRGAQSSSDVALKGLYAEFDRLLSRPEAPPIPVFGQKQDPFTSIEEADDTESIVKDLLGSIAKHKKEKDEEKPVSPYEAIGLVRRGARPRSTSAYALFTGTGRKTK